MNQVLASVESRRKSDVEFITENFIDSFIINTANNKISSSEQETDMEDINYRTLFSMLLQIEYKAGSKKIIMLLKSNIYENKVTLPFIIQ